MIIIKNGDLLKAKEDILVHQVNIQGNMGGGVAKQIATQYLKVESEYRRYCNNKHYDYNLLRGTVDLTQEDGKYIANMFSQDENFNTDYEAMEIALDKIKKYAKQEKLTVAMPYGIGCGIANGKWEIVFEIIYNVFKGYEVVLYRLEE